jgi:myo-inositol 2-dehydrogenase / D-chiro-inositol 1-dehydrogenase
MEIEGKAEFPKSGLWNVHGEFDVHAKYADGTTMEISSKFPNGIRFEGQEGWIFVSRGNAKVTASDPTSNDPNNKALQVSDPKLLEAKIGPDGVQLYESPEQHLNWLECIRSRRQPAAPAEIGHRSCSVCLLSQIAMKLPRKLHWDPTRETFINDKEANGMLSRPQRKPWGTNYVMA